MAKTKFNLIPKVKAVLTASKKKMEAIEIADKIIDLYPEDVKVKIENKTTDTPIRDQLRAEIGAVKEALKSSGVTWNEDKPRKYFIQDQFPLEQAPQEELSTTEESLKEYELYPVLIDYLQSIGILSKRIDEKKSKKLGRNHNKHLHPDIVGIDQHSKSFSKTVQSILLSQGIPLYQLTSYEVKVQINSGNARIHYGQAVDNSTWANRGYLVASEILEGALEELKVLNKIHGIGVILLNKDNPSESQILIESKERDLSGDGMDRLFQVNSDFQDFCSLVEDYLSTGKLKEKDFDLKSE